MQRSIPIAQEITGQLFYNHPPLLKDYGGTIRTRRLVCRVSSADKKLYPYKKIRLKINQQQRNLADVAHLEPNILSKKLLRQAEHTAATAAASRMSGFCPTICASPTTPFPNCVAATGGCIARQGRR